MAKLVPLSRGLSAIVDDADFAELSSHKWYALLRPKSGTYYAARMVSVPRKRVLYMHRALLGEPSGMKVDHKNHNTLDNRRGNLRTATNQQNIMNRRGPNRNSRSGVRGVCWRSDIRRWQATICVNGKQMHLGYFNDISGAAAAYAVANKKLCGEWGGALRVNR